MDTRSVAGNNQADAASAAEVRLPASLPMYIAAYVVSACGLIAAGLNLGDTTFTNLTLGLSTIGFAVSFISRKQNIAPRNVEAPAIIVCVLLCIVAMMDPVLPFLAPARGIDDRSQSLVVFLTWLVVFRSFTLISEGMLLFCCVPTLALIGLVSTMTGDGLILRVFFAFVCGSVFMMVHENVLRTRPTINRYQRTTLSSILFGSQLQIAAVCALGATALANIVAVPMRYLGSYMMFSAAMTPPGQTNRNAAASTRVSVEERTDLNVGRGPVRLSNEVLMKVKAARGSYWRGGSLDQYTGRGWKNTLDRTSLTASDAPRDADGLLDDPTRLNALYTFKLPQDSLTQNVRSHRLQQQVQLVAGQFSEIYGAAEPREVHMTEERADYDDGGGIHLLRSVQNQRYDVVSDIPDWTDDSLRAAPARYPDRVRAKYLQLPSVDRPAIAKLRDTALQVTAGKKTAYDRVRALEAWIAAQCKYNTDTPAYPLDQDVASFFLFTAKQGYCDSFATALAVLCRTIGIPARVASGFITGELNSQTGEYHVRERDKHLWTEVFFPGTGWVSFDATSNAEDISGQSETTRSGDKGSFMAFLFQRGWLPPTIIAVVVCMLLYVVKVEVLDRARRQRIITSGLGFPVTNMAIIHTYESVGRLLHGKGLPRAEHETPDEYLSRVLPIVESAVPAALPALGRLTDLLVRYRYSTATATEAEVQAARDAQAALAQCLKPVSAKSLLPAVATGSA